MGGSRAGTDQLFDKNAKKSIDTDYFLSFVSYDRNLSNLWSSCVEMIKKMVTPFVNDFVSNCRTPFVNPSNSVAGGIPILLVPSLQNSEQDEICFSTLENFRQNKTLRQSLHL